MLPLVAALVGLSILAPLAMWALAKEREARAQREEAWREYAFSRGFRRVEAEGPWYRRRSARIEGASDGLAVTVDTYSESTGDTSTTYTRVRAERSDFPSGKLRVKRRNRLAKWWWERSGGRPSPTGDAGFDERFSVRAAGEQLLSRVLRPEVRAGLAGFPKAPTLTCERGQITLRWVGAECDPEVLDRAIGIVALAAGARGFRELRA